MHPSSSNIGAYVKSVGASAAIQGLAPVAQATTTGVYGPAIDISGAKSCVLTGLTGAATGTPDSYTVAYSLEVSVNAGFSTPVAVDNSTVTLTADNKAGEVDVNLMDLDAGYYYARVKCVVTHVNGTSPKALVGAVVTLGGYQNLPV